MVVVLAVAVGRHAGERLEEAAGQMCNDGEIWRR
jgi:hypothetical protein